MLINQLLIQIYSPLACCAMAETPDFPFMVFTQSLVDSSEHCTGFYEVDFKTRAGQGFQPVKTIG